MSDSWTADPPAAGPPAVPASWLLEAVQHRCEACGVKAPTKQVSFNQHIGLVVIMFHREVKGRFCKRCLNAKFWTCTLVTLFFGWWGVISVFVTPIVLIANLVRYLASLGLEPPPRGGAAEAAAPDLLLEPHADEIVERVRERQTFGRLVREVAEPLGVSRSQLAAFLWQLVAAGRLKLDEGSSKAEPAAATGLPPSRRVVGPGVALAILGVINLLWVALFTTLMLTMTDTSLPPKDAPADAALEKGERRPLTPEEREENQFVGLLSAAVNGSAGLVLLLGGVQTARRRWRPLGILAALVAMVPLVTVCCFAGLPVGIWALAVLFNADVRETFS